MEGKFELTSQTGVHGKILSSDYGRPLPASLSIKGINSTVCSLTVVTCHLRVFDLFQCSVVW